MEAEQKIMMPVISVESRYLAPLKYDDLINIRTILHDARQIDSFFHEIYNGENQLCHKAKLNCFVDMISQKRVSAPQCW